MQIPNIFTSFSRNFFLTIFLVNSKLWTAKKSKTTTFSRVFHPKKIHNFLGKSKLNFWTKNEDFEQCVKKEFEFWSGNIYFFTFFQLHWDVKLSTLVMKGTTDWTTPKLQILENRVMNNRFRIIWLCLN